MTGAKVGSEHQGNECAEGRGSGGPCDKGSRPRRNRSSSRRRKIREELQSKSLNQREVLDLQKALLAPGAAEPLVEAARKLFVAEDYQAVVEERALEGACGYPPCRGAVTYESTGKKWTVNVSEYKVYATEEVSRFCSLACMRESSAFAARLEPEPAYVRPASTIAATRAAVANALSPPAALAGNVREALPEGSGPDAAAEKDSDRTATPVDGAAPPRPALPKVRQKAVVRFSRTQQTYEVRYDQYDGGGALPEVTPVVTAIPGARSEEHAAKAMVPTVSESTTVCAQSDLSTHAALGRCFDNGIRDAEGASTARTGGRGRPLEAPAADDSDGDAGDAAGAPEDDSGEELFEADAMFPAVWTESPFVRSWGVLTNWLSDFAMGVLRGAKPECVEEEGRPGHKGRRDLLLDLLSSRVPGEFTFLASRFYDVVSSLGVHQTLPSVTETKLYDLHALLLLRAIIRIDVQRGALSPMSHGALDKRVSAAAKALRITDEELQILDAMFA